MKRTILCATLSLICVASFACTNLIVGKKASVDGSVICTYNCDGFGFALQLSYSPAGKLAPGEMLAEIEWKLNHRPRKSLGSRTPLEYCKQLFKFDF